MSKLEDNVKFDFPMVGEDGNAFMIMGRFQGLAKRNGWSQDDINAVFEEAKSGDYDNLLQTFCKYTNAM